MRTLSALILTLSCLLISGCEQELTPDRMTSGEDLYNYYCMNCHEQHGPGAHMERYADKEPMKPYKIILMIKFGYNQDKHSMPVFDQLSEEQADAIARHVIYLQTSHKPH